MRKRNQAVFEERRGFGERASDVLASFGGSWPFIILFLLVLLFKPSGLLGTSKD